MKSYKKTDNEIFFFSDGRTQSIPNEIDTNDSEVVIIVDIDTDTRNSYIKDGRLVPKTLDELHIEEQVRKAHLETLWQEEQLKIVEKAIQKSASDVFIPEQYSELRVTTEREYYALLMDRKLLSEYIKQPDFPHCGRPTLISFVFE